MMAIDPIYEEGCAAGRAGLGPEANPYPDRREVADFYTHSKAERWEAGRKRGQRWCPHCEGTGQLPEGR